MKLIVISASMRGNSQSLKVAKWLSEHARSLGHEADVFDLHSFKLPLFDDDETETPKKAELRSLMNEQESFVFVSPEWNGMMSHGLINMLHFIGHEMAYKPVMLVGVSAGRGGTHPLDQMKLLGQKNRHYVISPESLVVSGVEGILNDHDMDASCSDFPVKNRADYSLRILAELSAALSTVRSSGTIDLQNFANGV